MMMNLFSIFDPATSLFISMNWVSVIYIVLFMPNLYWFVPSRWNYVYEIIFKYLMSEFYNLLMNKSNNINILMFMSIFISIMLNNFLGMFSYYFTATSHLSVSMTMSLTLWFTNMLYGWMNNMDHMFIHLVPKGTPSGLMPLMVVIESISNIIRPLTLSVRLSANMIAGHLLMTLISSTGSSLSMLMLIIMIMSQSVLIVLELSVSVIQAYVFTVLSTLYSSETN